MPFGFECVVVREALYEVRVPTSPDPCSYVRIVTCDGREVVYWDENEWAEAPAEVMGAITGAIASIRQGDRLDEIIGRRPGQ